MLCQLVCGHSLAALQNRRFVNIDFEGKANSWAMGLTAGETNLLTLQLEGCANGSPCTCKQAYTHALNRFS